MNTRGEDHGVVLEAACGLAWPWALVDGFPFLDLSLPLCQVGSL